MDRTTCITYIINTPYTNNRRVRLAHCCAKEGLYFLFFPFLKKKKKGASATTNTENDTKTEDIVYTTQRTNTVRSERRDKRQRLYYIPYNKILTRT